MCVVCCTSMLHLLLLVVRFPLQNSRKTRPIVLVNKITVLRSIHQSKGQMKKFNSVWKPLLSLIRPAC